MTISRRRVPWVTLFLVTVISTIWVTAEWIGDLAHRDDLLRLGAQDDVRVWNGETFRLATALFVHSGWRQLAVSCLALLVFGFGVERRMGSVKFAAIYIVSGAMSGLAALVLPPHTMVLGASGPIFGIGAAFLLLESSRTDRYGYLRVRWFFPVLLGLVAALDVLLTTIVGRLDLAQHLGGFLAGAGTAYVLTPPEGRHPFLIFRRARLFRQPIYFSVEGLYPDKAGQMSAIFDEEVRYDPGFSKRKVTLLSALSIALVALLLYGTHPLHRYEFHLYRADRALATGDWDRALDAYQRVGEDFEEREDRSDPFVDYRLGFLHGYRGENDQALEHLDRAIVGYEGQASRGGAVDDESSRPPFFIDARLWRVSIYRRIGEHEKAVAEAEFLVENLGELRADPDAPEHMTARWLARVYLGTSGDPAASDLDRQRVELARDLAARSIRHRESARTLDVLGMAYFRLSDYELAARTLERATVLSADGSIWYHLGLVQIRLQEREQALRSLGRAFDCAAWIDAGEIPAARAEYDRFVSAERQPGD